MKLQKRRKCLHKQLMEISPKVRKWSKVNVPLFPNIPQQFPCSLKVILKYPLFPKSKWGCSLACSLKPLGGPRYCLEVLLLHTKYISIIMSIPCRLRQDVRPGLYSPWEGVTTSHHGSQVSLLLLLTRTVLSLISLLSPTMLFSG